VPTRAGTIRGVQTDPAYRRRGFARALMLLAHDYIWQQADMGILLSSEMALPFYRGLAWEIFRGTVLCDQPDGRIRYTDVIPEGAPMLLLRNGATAPTREIDLRGLPF
jgi:GNAT superfamily N-acetyltransferase